MSTCLIAEVCHDSNDFCILKVPLSIMCESSKLMQCPNVRACFTMFELLAQVLTLLRITSYVRLSVQTKQLCQRYTQD